MMRLIERFRAWRYLRRSRRFLRKPETRELRNHHKGKWPTV